MSDRKPHRNRHRNRWILFFALFALNPNLANATRTMHPPVHTISNWFHAFGNVCQLTTGSFVGTGIGLTLTNISTVNQTVTITVTPQTSLFSSSNDNSDPTLPPQVLNSAMGYSPAPGGAANPTQTPISSPITNTTVIAPGSSIWPQYTVEWGGATKTSAGPGDWSLAGALDIVITVAEDRGALTGLFISGMGNRQCDYGLNPTFQYPVPGALPPVSGGNWIMGNSWGTGVAFPGGTENDGIYGFITGMVTNTQKTFYLNGGRPF